MTGLSLPGRLAVLTDRTQARGDLLDVVGAAVEGGARVVILREKDLPQGERRAIALGLIDKLGPVDGMLLVASDLDLARQVGPAGVHLAGKDPWPEGEDRPAIVGRSCHTADELRVAWDHGADYATVSPVFSTSSKPGYGSALGLEGLAQACRRVPELPVIALGGIGPGRVAACLAAGAAGVAVMGEVMRADDPAQVVRALLDEIGASASRAVGQLSSATGSADGLTPHP